MMTAGQLLLYNFQCCEPGSDYDLSFMAKLTLDEVLRFMRVMAGMDLATARTIHGVICRCSPCEPGPGCRLPGPQPRPPEEEPPPPPDPGDGDACTEAVLASLCTPNAQSNLEGAAKVLISAAALATEPAAGILLQLGSALQLLKNACADPTRIPDAARRVCAAMLRTGEVFASLPTPVRILLVPIAAWLFGELLTALAACCGADVISQIRRTQSNGSSTQRAPTPGRPSSSTATRAPLALPPRRRLFTRRGLMAAPLPPPPPPSTSIAIPGTSSMAGREYDLDS